MEQQKSKPCVTVTLTSGAEKRQFSVNQGLGTQLQAQKQCVHDALPH